MIELPSVTDQLNVLLHHLDDGWHIEAPLLQRTVLHGAPGVHAVLEAILVRNGTRRYIALPDDADIRCFLEQQHLRVLPV